MKNTQGIRSSLLLLIAALAGTLAAYLPSLSDYLSFDDFPHIAPLYSALQSFSPLGFWEAIWSSNSGPTGRPVAMATLVTQVALPGGDPSQLKGINLLIHSLVGIALYRLLYLLLTRAGTTTTSTINHPGLIAACAAALWLLHPFNLTSVAYTVQRMNSLAALFTVLALTTYLELRTDPPGAKKTTERGILLLTFWALGIFSKENAALLPLFILVLEITILRSSGNTFPLLPTNRHHQRLLFMSGAAAALAISAWAVLHYAGGYGGRPFDLPERLMTQGRILAWYLQMIIVPDIDQMSLYHDDWLISRSLTSPVSTLVSWLAIGMLVTGAVIASKRYPIVAFGLLWFFAGHLLESTIIPLELVFEHRNYLPSIGILLAIVIMLNRLLSRVPWPASALVAITIAASIYLGAATHARAERWADDPHVRLEHLEARGTSLRARIEAAQIHSDLAATAGSTERKARHLQKAETIFSNIASSEPRNTAALYGWILFRAEHEQENVAALIAELNDRLESQSRIQKTASNGIHALRKCALGGPCKPYADRILQIIDTALRAPETGPGNRSRLLRDRAHLLLEKRTTEALESMRQAVQLRPEDIDTRIDYAGMLVRAGEREAALEQVRAARALDQWGHHAHTLKNLRMAVLSGA